MFFLRTIRRLLFLGSSALAAPAHATPGVTQGEAPTVPVESAPAAGETGSPAGVTATGSERVSSNAVNAAPSSVSASPAQPETSSPSVAAQPWTADEPEAELSNAPALELSNAPELPASETAMQRARWYVGIDRLALITFWNVDHTLINNVRVSENGTQATLVGGSSMTGAIVPLNPYSIPRLSLDRVVRHNMTFGVGATFYKSTGGWDAEQSGATASGEGQQSWLVAVSPRMGYLVHVTPAVLMWARVGGTLSKQHSENPTFRNDALLGSFDLSLSGVFRVVNPLALIVSLDLAVPFDGVTTIHYEPAYANRNEMPAYQSHDVTLRALALQFGALMYL